MALESTRIGLALGSGSARGWSHIGVLRALQDIGIRPTVVAGASTGSLVAAAFASEQLDALESWVRTLTKMDVWRLLDATFTGGGMIRGNRLMRAVAEQLEDQPIDTLPHPFGAVATDLYSGEEIWLRQGSMLEAVRASSGLPGLFTPIRHQGRWLIDGGVVNPVPVSLCRALGADYVIAVNLNRPVAGTRTADSQERKHGKKDNRRTSVESDELFARWSGLFENFVTSLRSSGAGDDPGMLEVMYTTINIMQDHIIRGRLIDDPPDLMLRPDLEDFHMMDFHRAAEAIDIGHATLQKISDQLVELQKT
jgi:NTE family protein